MFVICFEISLFYLKKYFPVNENDKKAEKYLLGRMVVNLIRFYT